MRGRHWQRKRSDVDARWARAMEWHEEYDCHDDNDKGRVRNGRLVTPSDILVKATVEAFREVTS